jgi:membrane-associated phospholipid phosphatase
MKLMMRLVGRIAALAMVGFVPLGVAEASAQTPQLTAIAGLVTLATLDDSAAGKAALTANFKVTAAIQSGAETQPTLLPFPAQQGQALKDAVITGGDASQLADALGTTLGGVYQAKAHYTGLKTFTSLSGSVASLITYTAGLSGGDSNAGKFFFANATTNGKTPASPAALAILTAAHGLTDILGKAYDRPAGSPGADPYGDSRPFQTQPSILSYKGTDFFGAPSGNTAYLMGPAQNLTDNPSYPSGHTTYGYTESLLLAIMVPERFRQEITRGAEYGNDRIILGAHYAVDIIAGRTLALHDVAQLLAGNAAYLGQTVRHAQPITDYRAALQAATQDLRTDLAAGCGNTIAVCAEKDTSLFKGLAADRSFYEVTQTYGLPVVYPAMAKSVEDVAKVAPEAGYLLTVAFPHLTLAQADALLTQTEGPGGGFLDNGSAFGVYSRLDLFAAASLAAQ